MSSSKSIWNETSPFLNDNDFIKKGDVHITAIIALEGGFAFARGDGSIIFTNEEGIEKEVQAYEESLLAASPYKDGLVTCSDDGKIIAINSQGDTTILFEEFGRFFDQIATSSWNGIAAADGRLIKVLMPEGDIKTYKAEGSIGGLAFTPKGRKLAASRNGGVSVYWVGTQKPEPDKYEWQGAHGPVTISPNGDFLVTSMHENALHIWRMDHKKHGRMGGYPTRIKSLSWDPKGQYLATSGTDGIVIWPFISKDGPIGQAAEQIPLKEEEFITALSWHPKADIIAAGSENGFIYLARRDGANRLLAEKLGSTLTTLIWSKDGKTLAFGCDEGAFGFIKCETFL